MTLLLHTSHLLHFTKLVRILADEFVRQTTYLDGLGISLGVDDKFKESDMASL